MADTPVKVFCRHCHAKLDVSDLEPFTFIECPDCGTRLRVPRRFERYLLEKVCGTGGMSTVYRAIEPDLARRVAIKVMKPATEAEGMTADRFIEEARLVAKINHPGVIPIFNCGVFERQAVVVMRYMEHGSLDARMKQQPPTLAEACNWLASIAGGLEFAWRESIVHHDVKPGNIMLTASDEAKLGDFDLADLRAAGDSLTLCNGNWGSPGYVSPERLLYGGEDYHGDIFSLGATLYEMVTGELPFGTGSDVEALLARREFPVYRKLHEFNPAVRPELSRLLDRMLRYLPEERPDYPEIVEELQRSAEAAADSSGENGGSLMGKLTGWLKK